MPKTPKSGSKKRSLHPTRRPETLSRSTLEPTPAWGKPTSGCEDCTIASEAAKKEPFPFLHMPCMTCRAELPIECGRPTIGCIDCIALYESLFCLAEEKPVLIARGKARLDIPSPPNFQDGKTDPRFPCNKCKDWLEYQSWRRKLGAHPVFKEGAATAGCPSCADVIRWCEEVGIEDEERRDWLPCYRCLQESVRHSDVGKNDVKSPGSP